MATISKAAAAEAARKITEPIAVKAKEAESALNKEMGTIYEKHLPIGVMEMFAKFPEFCKHRTGISLTGNGFNHINVQMNKRYPDNGNYTFQPTKEEASKLQKLIDKVSDLKKSRQDTIVEIENTLLTLGTHKRIQAEFPEAYPFLPVVSNNTGVMIAIQPIRNKVKKLTA